MAMTKEDQGYILIQMKNHLAMNKGNTITDVVAQGLLTVLAIITNEKVGEPAPEAQKE